MSTDVEERVRRALTARAGQVTPGRLQPAVPPTAAPARRSWRSWWPVLLVAATVLVAVVFLVRLPAGDPPQPIPVVPAATVPGTAPTPSSSGADVTPTPTATSAATSPAASPAPSAATSPGASPVPTTSPPGPEITPPA